MRITFVVKGENTMATLKAIDAKLDQYKINARLINNTKDCQVFETYPHHIDALAQWFSEVPALIPGYGYPAGTCLIYSVHPDEPQTLIDVRD